MPEGEGLALGEADGEGLDPGVAEGSATSDGSEPGLTIGTVGGWGGGSRAMAAPRARPPTRIPASSPVPTTSLPPMRQERTSTIGWQ